MNHWLKDEQIIDLTELIKNYYIPNPSWFDYYCCLDIFSKLTTKILTIKNLSDVCRKYDWIITSPEVILSLSKSINFVWLENLTSLNSVQLVGHFMGIGLYVHQGISTNTVLLGTKKAYDDVDYGGRVDCEQFYYGLLVE